MGMARLGGELGFKLTRYAFAIMIKFSGLIYAFESLIQYLDLEEESEMIPKENPGRE